MNKMTNILVTPGVRMGLVPLFPHIATDVWICDDEKNEEGCKWITMDATMDDTRRLLEVRPVPDNDYIGKEEYPATIQEWKDKNIRDSPFINLGLSVGDIPIIKDGVRMLFNTKFFTQLMKANPHIQEESI